MLTFRLLDTRVSLSSNLPELEESLSELAAHPRQEGKILAQFRVEILKSDRGWLYRENQGDILCSRRLDWLTVYVHQRINRLGADRHAGDLLIHAASGTLQGKRFLLAGDRGVGKTTFITRLLFEGAEAHGDDLVLLRGSSITPFPRKFHIKPGTQQMLPQLKAGGKNRRFYPSGSSSFFFFDPRQSGRPWNCLPGGVDAVFHLRPNHGGKTRLRQCKKYLLAAELLRHVENYSDRNRERLPDLFAMLNQAECFELDLGDLDTAVRELWMVLQ